MTKFLPFLPGRPYRPSTYFSDVKWLWRYEDGPMDCDKVMDSAGQSDIVLTAPHFIGEVRSKEDLDNHHNAEFAERLSGTRAFADPFALRWGGFEPVEVVVFVKKTLACRLGEQAGASP